MACENLCTAEKCAELEARIEQLEATLEAHLTKSIPEAHDYNSNLQIEAFMTGQELGISIADVTSTDTANITIPFCDEDTCEELEKRINDHINQNIPDAHDYECDLSIEAFYTDSSIAISIASCFGNDTTSVELPFCTIEDCGQIENEITNINNEITNINNNFFTIENNFNAFFNSFSFNFNKIENDYNTIITIIETLPEEITKGCSISGFVQGDYLELYLGIGTCFSNTSILLPMAEDCCAEILQNIEELKAVTGSLINQIDYRAGLIEDDVQEVKELVSVPISGEIEIGDCVDSGYQPNPTGLPYGGDGLIGIHNLLQTFDSKFTSIFTAICESSSSDVVSLLATDKDAARVSSKVLVLHLVRLTDYPRRTTNTIWQAQIPLAKDSYDWEDDFESLRWYRGNIYAELRFVEPLNPVSGFFENETRANQYFDAVLNLTNATQSNRIITLHNNPKVNILQQTTRPYRAFIFQPQPNGKPLCLQKYLPDSP